MKPVVSKTDSPAAQPLAATEAPLPRTRLAPQDESRRRKAPRNGGAPRRAARQSARG